MFKRSRLAVSVSGALLALLGSSSASALDVGALPDMDHASVAYGSALIGKSGSSMSIDASQSTGTNGNTLIEWGGSGFNVGKDASVSFTAQSNASIILNHDTSGKMSILNGDINSDLGNIVIVNPNGIEHSGGGSARLSLIAGNPTREDFGLSSSDGRIEVTFDQTTPKITSQLSNMTPSDYTGSGLNVESTGILQMHSNAKTISLYGGKDGSSSSLSVYNSDFSTTQLSLYGLGIDPRTVDKTEMPTVSIVNSHVTGSNFYANENGVLIKKSLWNESDLSNPYGVSYNNNVVIKNSTFDNLTLSSSSYGSLDVSHSTFNAQVGLQATDFSVTDSTFTGNSQFDSAVDGINATRSFTFERNKMISPDDGNWSTSYVTAYGLGSGAHFSFSDNSWDGLGTVIMTVDSAKNLTFTDIDELRFTTSLHENSILDNLTYTNSHNQTMYGTVPVVSFEVGYDATGFKLSNSSFTGVGSFTYLNHGPSGNYLDYTPGPDQFSNLKINMDGDVQFTGKLNMENVQVNTKSGIFLKDITDPAQTSYIRDSLFKTQTGNIYTMSAFKADDGEKGDINFVNNGDSKTYGDQSGSTIKTPYCVGSVCVNSTSGELTDPDSDETNYANYYHQYDIVNKGESIVIKSSGGLTVANSTFQIGETPVVTPPTDGGSTIPPGNGGTNPGDGTGTTPPSNGGGTTPPDDGGGTTPPGDGGSTTPPNDGGGTTPPGNGGTNPDDGTGTTPPSNGGGATPPGDSGGTPPGDGSSNIPPGSGGSTPPPDGGGATTPPGDNTGTPPTGENGTTPPTGNGEDSSQPTGPVAPPKSVQQLSQQALDQAGKAGNVTGSEVIIVDQAQGKTGIFRRIGVFLGLPGGHTQQGDWIELSR